MDDVLRIVALTERADEAIEKYSTLLDESGLLVGASVEQQRADGAQTLGAIMTTLNEMRRTPAIAVAMFSAVSEDLEGSEIEGGWNYLAVVFPGFAVMFIFINVAYSASSLLTERESGTLRRLLAAPLERGSVIAGKMVAYTLLACLQVLVLFGVARILFDIPMGQSPLRLVVLSLVVALISSAMGMMIAGVAKPGNQASNIGMILGLVLAVIGGCLPMAGGHLPCGRIHRHPGQTHPARPCPGGLLPPDVVHGR